MVTVTGGGANITIDGWIPSLRVRILTYSGLARVKSSPEDTSILGGLPGIPLYLDSTSTSGRYEGRALQTGDVIEARATDLHSERTSRS